MGHVQTVNWADIQRSGSDQVIYCVGENEQKSDNTRTKQNDRLIVPAGIDTWPRWSAEVRIESTTPRDDQLRLACHIGYCPERDR